MRVPYTSPSICNAQAGPTREGQARRGHPLERDDVARQRVGGEQRAQVGPAEAAVRGEALALDGQEVDHRAVGVDDADPVLAGRRHVGTAVDVVAEAVATTV